jgi:protein O-mannosyl-transferase
MKKQNSNSNLMNKEESKIINQVPIIAPLLNTHKIALAIIFLCSILLYANTVTHNYALDDQLAIYDNTYVKNGFGGIHDLLTHDAFVGFFGERGSKLISGGRYRPLSFISFAIEWQLFDRSPMISHIVNIIIYGLLCSFIYLFLVWLFPPKSENETQYSFLYSVPFLATMFYVSHPIHTEVVANIKGRDELLSFLFAILTLIYFFQLSKNKLIDILVTGFLFFLALMSKENAITFLAVIPIVFILKGELKSSQNQFITHFAAMILVTGLFLFLRFKYTSSGFNAHSEEILNNPFVRASDSEKWGTIMYSFYRYFALMLFPHPLTHDYYFNQIPYRKLSDPIVITTFLGLFALIVVFFKTLNTRKEIAFSILFFIITFSIVSNVLFTVGIIMNERFVFVSSLGFCIILASMLYYLNLNKQVLMSILILIFSLYSFKTYTRNLAWKDNFTLFATDYNTSNQSAKVSTALGGVLMERANDALSNDTNLYKLYVDSSIRVLRHAIDIYPQNSQSILLYGNSVYAKNRNVDEAISIYQDAIRYRPGGYFDALYNIGVLYFNQGKLDSSLKYTEKAYNANKEHKEVKDMLAKLYAKQGRSIDAVQLAGSNSTSLGDLAMNAKDGGNYQEAISLADQALAVNSNDAKANFVKGICYARFLNRMQEGIPYLEKAISLDQNNGYWLEDLAVAYGMSGQIKKTIPILERVIELRPNEPAGYQNLATSYANLGQKDKAQYYMNLAQQKVALPK